MILWKGTSMCIMSIHFESKTANAVQAAAHNQDTQVRDLAQLLKLLEARHETEAMAWVRAELKVAEASAERLWTLWRAYVPTGAPGGSATGTGWRHDRKADAHVRENAYGTEAGVETRPGGQIFTASDGSQTWTVFLPKREESADDVKRRHGAVARALFPDKPAGKRELRVDRAVFSGRKLA